MYHIISDTYLTRILRNVKRREKIPGNKYLLFLSVIQAANHQEGGHGNCNHYSSYRSGVGKPIAGETVIYQYRSDHGVIGNDNHRAKLTKPAAPHHQHAINDVLFRVR